MADYELKIEINPEDVQQINGAKQKVTITKEVSGGTSVPVAWVAFEPLSDNELTWEQKYGVYASTTEIQNGAKIVKGSAVNPATSGVYHPFELGAFSGPYGTTSRPNEYGIENRASDQLTFGLAQSVTANGNPFEANPLNAVPVLTRQTATFLAKEKLRVFLHGAFDNGVVISEVQGMGLEVDLTTDPIQTIHYSKSKGGFLLGSLF